MMTESKTNKNPNLGGKSVSSEASNSREASELEICRDILKEEILLEFDQEHANYTDPEETKGPELTSMKTNPYKQRKREVENIHE